MTTTDSNGIAFLEETDPVSPLHTTINTLQTATSTAVGKAARGPLYAANVAARDALLAQYGSSASSPLWVDVAGILQRHNGIAWVAMSGDDTGWINATLLNGWMNFGGAYQPIQYRRRDGIVHIRGMMKSGGGGNLPGNGIFQLPAGFRPLAFQVYTCWGNGAPCAIEVAPSGFVVVGDIPAYPLRQALDITFPAEQ